MTTAKLLSLFELLLAVYVVLLDVYNWVKSLLTGSLHTLPGRGASRCAATAQQDASASAGGLAPQAPPTTLAIVVAEADARAIGTQHIVELLTWCSDSPSLQQVYLYDPAGHIKARQEALAFALSAQGIASNDIQQQPGSPFLAPESNSAARASGSSLSPYQDSSVPGAPDDVSHSNSGSQLLLKANHQGQLQCRADGRRGKLRRAVTFEVGWPDLEGSQQPEATVQEQQQWWQNLPPPQQLQQELQQQEQQPQQQQPSIVLYPPAEQQLKGTGTGKQGQTAGLAGTDCCAACGMSCQQGHSRQLAQGQGHAFQLAQGQGRATQLGKQPCRGGSKCRLMCERRRIETKAAHMCMPGRRSSHCEPAEEEKGGRGDPDDEAAVLERLGHQDSSNGTALCEKTRLERHCNGESVVHEKGGRKACLTELSTSNCDACCGRACENARLGHCDGESAVHGKAGHEAGLAELYTSNCNMCLSNGGAVCNFRWRCGCASAMNGSSTFACSSESQCSSCGSTEHRQHRSHTISGPHVQHCQPRLHAEHCQPGFQAEHSKPGLHVRLLSATDSYVPVLAATRRLGSRLSPSAAPANTTAGHHNHHHHQQQQQQEQQQFQCGSAPAPEPWQHLGQGTETKELKLERQKQGSTPFSENAQQPSQGRGACTREVAGTLDSSTPSKKDSQQQQGQGHSAGAQEDACISDSSSQADSMHLWDLGSCEAQGMRLKAPGRTYRQSAAMLMQEMVAACGPGVMRDPQLILVYTSGPLTLAGFSPFHTRTPEVLGMGPLCLATESGFQAAFARYANVKQRFGK